MTKVILITGANRGIGNAIAKHLKSQGYRLSLGVRQPEKYIDGLEDEHRHFFDATDTDSADAWVASALLEFNRIDGLINCAGILKPFGINDDESALDEMWNVNVKGTLRISKAALPYLCASGSGRIINLVSMSGKRIKGQNIGYGMTKYAQLALSHGLRNIGWNRGVRVTAICPSWVKSDMAKTHSTMEVDEMTQPEDIARIAAMLIELPNSAAINEVAVNCNLETG